MILKDSALNPVWIVNYEYRRKLCVIFELNRYDYHLCTCQKPIVMQIKFGSKELFK